MSAFKFFLMVDVHADTFVYFTSSDNLKNEHEGQPPDCSISMKESEMVQVECVGGMQGNLLSDKLCLTIACE